MERATPVSYNPERTNIFKMGLYLPPYRECRTRVATFPSQNAYDFWGERGSFFTSSEVFVDGKSIAKIHTECVNEEGYVLVDLEEVSSLIDDDKPGMVIVEMNHDKKIPMETYATYQHRGTGSITSFPVAMFIGDIIYVEAHAEQLENTMFWPGIISDDQSESCIVVLNPFKVNYNYQLSLYTPDGIRHQSEVLRLKRNQFAIHNIEDIFPSQVKGMGAASQKFTFCVSAQYKVVSYFGIRDRKNGIFTTLDHLHPFILV